MNLGPMLCAAVAGNVEVLRQLVANRADVDERVPRKSEVKDLCLFSGMTPMHGACQYNAPPEVVQCLLELRANTGAVSDMGPSSLHFAAMGGSTKCLELLLDEGMEVDMIGALKTTPLMIAAFFGQADCLQLLLERRASLATRSDIGTDVFTNAAWSGSESCLRILLEHQADVNTAVEPPSALGRALWGAVRLGRALLGPSSLPGRLSNTPGCSALALASMFGNADQVKVLLAARADVTRRNWRGLDALELAKFEGHAIVEETLKNHIASTGTPSFFICV